MDEEAYDFFCHHEVPFLYLSMKKFFTLFGILLILLVTGVWTLRQWQAEYKVPAPVTHNLDEEVIQKRANVLSFLSLPPQTQLELFAQKLIVPRVFVRDDFENYWVSQPGTGAIAWLDATSGSGVQVTPKMIVDLNRPHGLAVSPDGADLYIAEEDAIIRARLYSDAPLEKIATLPPGDRHTTRTIQFGPDGRLYVSIGSTCDACEEEDERLGTILSMDADGSDERIIARGLRNAVFFDWHPITGELWATEMGRDGLGDDLPPDEINIIREGAHYGWPWCYGNQVRDETFRPDVEFDCAETESPHLTIPAHAAPLGLAFVPPNSDWPEYEGDLLVALHGSWNRSSPIGYEVARIPLSEQGERTGETVPFATGWLQPSEEKLGRPVDLLFEPDGSLLLTDDLRDAIYRFFRP